MIAILKGRVDMITMLLEYHADLNATTKLGFAPLHWACSVGNLETIQTLLAAGADPHTIWDDGITPIMVAIQRQRIKIAALVLEALLQRARQNAWPIALRRGLVHAVQVLPSWKRTPNLVRALAEETTETPPILQPQIQHLLFVELYHRCGGSWLRNPQDTSCTMWHTHFYKNPQLDLLIVFGYGTLVKRRYRGHLK